jgi:hypothetical protein
VNGRLDEKQAVVESGGQAWDIDHVDCRVEEGPGAGTCEKYKQEEKK